MRLRWAAVEALEGRGEVVRIQIPDLSGDFLDRQLSVLNELGGFLHSHPLQVFHRGAAEGCLEPPAEMAGAQSNRAGQ